MALELAHPIWLLALSVIALLYGIYRRSLVDFPHSQVLASLVVRSLVCTCLVLALAGLTLLKPTKQVFVVFALDESLSVDTESRHSANEFIQSAVQNRSSERYAVLPFAEKTQSFRRNISPDHKGQEPAPGSSVNDRHLKATNVQAAIEVAAAGIPPHFVPRIVLLSDGNETTGNALHAALQSRVRIDTVPLQTRADPELQVAELTVPAQVAVGEPFFVEVAVNANHEDEVQIEVFKGDHKVISSRKPVHTGVNRFKFQEQVDRPTEFSARITQPLDGAGQPVPDAFRDSLFDNNAGSGLVFASGKPRVLLLESAPDLAENLAAALREEGLLVDTRPPQGIPDDLAELQNYDAVVFSNVPATAISQRQMELIRTYVSDLGGGLVMLGGDQSFGLGGYYKSAIEDVLPVRSDFEKEKEKPSLAMVLVIDKSGSMGGQKIELAKDAAKAAVELLSDRDQIGIIAFDGQPYWVSDIRSGSQKQLVMDRISTIEPGGGTSIHPALEEAFDALQTASAKLKHVIVLTDGHSAPGDFDGTTRQMAAARITVSTVGIGDADAALLQRIADLGSGRYYFTRDPSNVPQIFAKETMTASKSAINEEPFLPQVIRSTPVLSEIVFDEAPFLLGYVVTRPKATSEVILATEAGDPLLAWWRYGLGMSVAFTSDAHSRWAAEWLTWPGYNQFWAQVIRYAMRKSESKGFTVDVQRTGSQARIVVDAIDADGQFLNGADSKLTLIDPKLTERKLPLEQVAPGRYEAAIEVAQPGAWHLQISQSKDGQTLHRHSRGLVVGYPDELRLRPTNEELLKSLARVTGGIYQPRSDEIFLNETVTAAQVVPLWPWLLMLALLIFVVDVALRRVDVSLIRWRPRHERSPGDRRTVRGNHVRTDAG